MQLKHFGKISLFFAMFEQFEVFRVESEHSSQSLNCARISPNVSAIPIGQMGLEMG
jgi:hypothetical protein